MIEGRGSVFAALQLLFLHLDPSHDQLSNTAIGACLTLPHAPLPRRCALTRGCSAQAWEANSSESCVLKVRFISSSDSPAAGGPEGLNTQEHSEQPHPSTICPSIHTNS